MKKLVVSLSVAGAALVAATYVCVDSYTKKMVAREEAILKHQQQAYATARERRVRELQAALVTESLKDKLGIADRPGVELRIQRQEASERGLVGLVEVTELTESGDERETVLCGFRIEFDDDNTVRTCEITEPH